MVGRGLFIDLVFDCPLKIAMNGSACLPENFFNPDSIRFNVASAKGFVRENIDGQGRAQSMILSAGSHAGSPKRLFLPSVLVGAGHNIFFLPLTA